MTTVAIPEVTPEKVNDAAAALRSFLEAWEDAREKMRVLAGEGWLVCDLVDVETRGLLYEANWMLREVLDGDINSKYVREEYDGFLWLAEEPASWLRYWNGTARREEWAAVDVEH